MIISLRTNERTRLVDVDLPSVLAVPLETAGVSTSPETGQQGLAPRGKSW